MKKDSWLYSDSFIRRAFAIWGHYFVANLIIGSVVMVLGFIIAIIFGSFFVAIFNIANEMDGRGPAMEQHDGMMDEMMDEDF